MSPGQRVLIVEDESLIAILIEESLRKLGCEIVGPASRLPQAEALARGAALDCAVLDVNVHGQPVYPIAGILAGRKIPFLFVTGYATTELAEGFRERPILRKPFTADELGEALERACAAPRPASG